MQTERLAQVTDRTRPSGSSSGSRTLRQICFSGRVFSAAMVVSLGTFPQFAIDATV